MDPRPGVRHYPLRRDNTADVERLARFVTGRAIGLVPGGGLARAFSHVGILRPPGELGIPVDMIGGASMGAAVAFGHAKGMLPDALSEGIREIFLHPSVARSITWPSLSSLNTRHMDAALRRQTEDLNIEDLPTGGQLFWSWLNPFHKRPAVPKLTEILMHSMLCASSIDSAQADLLIAPPVDDAGPMEVDRLDEVVDAAYHHCLEMAPELRALLD